MGTKIFYLDEKLLLLQKYIIELKIYKCDKNDYYCDKKEVNPMMKMYQWNENALQKKYH